MGCRRAGGGVGCKDDSGKLGLRGWCCQILQPRRKEEEQDCREEAEAEALCSTLWNGQKKTESSQRCCARHTLGGGAWCLPCELAALGFVSSREKN